MAGIGAALRSVAQKGAELARQLTEEAASGLSSFKFHREYQIVAQVGTAGPHGLWRIFSAAARSSTALVRDVSIWVLDKRQLLALGEAGAPLHHQGRSGSAHHHQAQQLWEAVLSQQRHGCATMTRIKHPGVVRVVQPLEETSSHMVLVTEAVRGCLRDLLVMQLQHHHRQPQHTAAAADTGAAAAAAGCGGGGSGGGPVLSLLEVKLGLLSLLDVLCFLHGTARVAHCGLAPQSVAVAADGSWKLAGFAFALPLPGSSPQQQAGGLARGGGGGAAGSSSAHAAAAPQPPYSYSDPFPPPWEELAKPQLPYTAPELIIPPGGGVGTTGPWVSTHSSPPAGDANPFLTPASSQPQPAAASSLAAVDAFSLGALAYEATAVAVLAEGGAASWGAASWGEWARPQQQQQGSAAEAAPSPPQLLPVRCSLQQYGSRLAALASAASTGAPSAFGGGGGSGSSLGYLPVASGGAGGGGGGAVGGAGGVAADLARVPPELHGVLLALVSPSPGCRPPLASLARLGWFEADPLLRALRFLEGMVQSEQHHKLAFLADLADERRQQQQQQGPVGVGSSWKQQGRAAAAAETTTTARDATVGGALWRRLPDRMLSSRVLPPLLQEVRTGGAVGVTALPVAVAIAQRLGRATFASLVLPPLTSVLEAAAAAAAGAAASSGALAASSGARISQPQQALVVALVGQAESLAGLMDGPTIDRLLVPMLLRALLGPGVPAVAADAAVAAEGGDIPAMAAAAAGGVPAVADPRLALAALAQLRRLVEMGLLDRRSAQARSRLLQPLLAAAARTTSAGVRSSCLGLVAELAGKVDRPEGEAVLSTCAQLLSVDGSGGTIVAVSDVLQSLSGAPAWGPVAAAQRLLPMLLPQLVAASLRPQQLASLSATVQAMLAGVTQYAESAARMRTDGGGSSYSGMGPAAAAGGGTVSSANGGASAAPRPPMMASSLSGYAAATNSDEKKHADQTQQGGLLAFTTWTSGTNGTSTLVANPPAAAAASSTAVQDSSYRTRTTTATTTTAAAAPAGPTAAGARPAAFSSMNPFEQHQSPIRGGGTAPAAAGGATAAVPADGSFTRANGPAAGAAAPFGMLASHRSGSGGLRTGGGGPPATWGSGGSALPYAPDSSSSSSSGRAQQQQQPPMLHHSASSSAACMMTVTTAHAPALSALGGFTAPVPAGARASSSGSVGHSRAIGIGQQPQQQQPQQPPQQPPVGLSSQSLSGPLNLMDA